MIGIVETTLIVILSVLVLFAQVAGIASFIMLILQGKRFKMVEANLVAAKAELDKDINTSKTELAGSLAAAQKELIEGQFKMADLFTTGMKAYVEYLNKVTKEIVDSNFDVVTKNADDILKLSTENSQKIYDSMFVLIKMTDGLMTALGYQPAPPETGLEEPKRGQNYGKPPAPEEKDGLVFSKH